MAKLADSRRQPGSVTPADLGAPPKGNRITYDDTVSGFGVRITAGGARSFVLSYTTRGGRERRATIGQWPAWSVAQAREQAKAWRREIDRGGDPMAERQHERQAPTVAALLDRYLREHVEVHNKPRTQVEVRRLVERLIKPKLGRLKVEALDYDDVAAFHRSLAKTPRQANFAIAALSKAMSLAELWKLRPGGSNPCRHLRRYDEKSRERFLKPAELQRVGEALVEMEAEGAIRPDAAAAIRFLGLSGMRLGEVAGMTWPMVDLNASEISLPDAKAGARVVPLGAPARLLLASLERTGERVFPIPARAIEAAWAGRKAQPKHRREAQEGVRDRAGVPDVRLHDLRHGYGTTAGGAGLNQFLVRDLLGHRTMVMAGRYVNRDVDPLRAAADLVSGKIAAAMAGEQAEVVPLRRGQR